MLAKSDELRYAESEQKNQFHLILGRIVRVVRLKTRLFSQRRLFFRMNPFHVNSNQLPCLCEEL